MEGDNIVRGRLSSSSTPGSLPLGPSFCQEGPEVAGEPKSRILSFLFQGSIKILVSFISEMSATSDST